MDMSKSRTYTHEFLAMWREKCHWIDESHQVGHEPSKEWWDGSKAREWSNFFDPNSEYELPVLCPDSDCGAICRTFLASSVGY